MRISHFCLIIYIFFSCATTENIESVIVVDEPDSLLENELAQIPDTALAPEPDLKTLAINEKDGGKKPDRLLHEGDHSLLQSDSVVDDYINRQEEPVVVLGDPTHSPQIELPSVITEIPKDVSNKDVIVQSVNNSDLPASEEMPVVKTNTIIESPPVVIAAPVEEAVKITETRTVNYNPDSKKVEVELKGLGWYLMEPPADGLEFLDMYPGEEKTLIVFLVYEDGRYVLRLVRQNFESGEEESQAIQLVVVAAEKADESGFAVETDVEKTSPDNTNTEDKTTAVLDSAAASELEDITANQPAVMTPAISDNELERLLMNAVALKRPLASLDILKELETATDLDADVLFLLGQYYDVSGPGKDMEKAYLYYGRLVNDFPLHEKWNEAVRRYRYLKNRFFG